MLRILDSDSANWYAILYHETLMLKIKMGGSRIISIWIAKVQMFHHKSPKF